MKHTALCTLAAYPLRCHIPHGCRLRSPVHHLTRPPSIPPPQICYTAITTRLHPVQTEVVCSKSSLPSIPSLKCCQRIPLTRLKAEIRAHSLTTMCCANCLGEIVGTSRMSIKNQMNLRDHSPNSHVWHRNKLTPLLDERIILNCLSMYNYR